MILLVRIRTSAARQRLAVMREKLVVGLRSQFPNLGHRYLIENLFQSLLSRQPAYRFNDAQNRPLTHPCHPGFTWTRRSTFDPRRAWRSRRSLWRSKQSGAPRDP